MEFLVNQHPRSLRLKAFLLCFVPLMTVTLLVTWLLFQQKLEREQAVLQATERHVIDVQSDILRYEVRMAISDLRFLSQELELERRGSHFQLVEHVGESYARFLRQKKLYDHLRFIDAKGIERIRIDYADDKTTVVESRKTSRADQPYFRETIGLKPGQIYISPLELDVEEKRRSGNLMPTIRFAAPIFDKHGNREGILALNYDVNRLNEYLDMTHANTSGRIMLLNGDGFYLHHDNPRKLWGFASGGENSQSFVRDYPDAWTYIRSHSAGQIETRQGIFTFTSHALGVTDLTDYAGSNVSVVSHPEWYVVSWYPISEGAAMRERLAAPYFEQYLLLLLLMVGLCWFFALSRARRWISDEKVKVLSRAIDQAGESVIITNSGGVIEYVNPGFTQVTGYTADEALGKTPGMLKSGKQSEEFYQNFWQTIMSGNIWSRAIVDKRKNGELYPAMMTVSPIKDDHGRITHYVGVQQDMSEYQMLEEKLRHAHKMEAVATLVGGIAHEFNNMLTAITGNLYLARHGKAGEDVVEKLEAAEKQSFAAAEMIDQLLTFSKQGMVDLQPLRLDHFVEEAVRMAMVSLPDEVQVDLRIEAGNLAMDGDATMLREVLHSLIDNARDAVSGISQPMIIVGLDRMEADAGFQERFEGAREGEYAHIWIRDNGCGIPEDHQAHVFEPFFTTKPVGKGSGLGLAMSFGAVQTHGGYMEFDSAAGCGTTMHIYLPLIKPDDRGAESHPDAGAV